MPLHTVRFSHFADREAVVSVCFPQALAERVGIGNAVKALAGRHRQGDAAALFRVLCGSLGEEKGDTVVGWKVNFARGSMLSARESGDYWAAGGDLERSTYESDGYAAAVYLRGRTQSAGAIPLEVLFSHSRRVVLPPFASSIACELGLPARKSVNTTWTPRM
ncbi:hypothetical protein PspLS_10612 [Pyricularia sp. CBS 133598]|nr:hypothetical protein PspLS_10612 [Pyricularia sp. CBS 133598]